IVLLSKITIAGAGRGVTIFRAAPSFNAGQSPRFEIFRGSNLSYIEFRNIQVDGNYANQPAPGGINTWDAIALNTCTDITVRDCEIHHLNAGPAVACYKACQPALLE